MNRDLVEYIKSQLSAGIEESEIKRILTENGWANEDIEANFAFLKSSHGESETEPVEIPVEAGLTTKYDLGIPSEVKADSIKQEENISTEPLKTETKPNHTQNLVKALIIFGVIIILGFFTWAAAKYLSGWISQKEPELNRSLLSPVTNETVTGTGMSAEADVVNKNLVEPTPFVSKKMNFELSPPRNWNIDESGSFGTLVTMSNPQPDVDGGNKFSANLNVVSEQAGGVSLDDYLNASKEVLNKSFTDYQLIDEKRVDLNGKTGILLEAKYNMGVYPLHNLQLMLVSNDTAYVLTATSLDSTWDIYKEVFEVCLLSFNLK